MTPRDRKVVKRFAFALKHLRLERSWNRTRLSDIANIERKHILRLENGEVDPTIGTVYKIAHAIGIGVAEIIDLMEQSDKR